ncbi:MAG: hypothetical protein ACKVX7_10440 [Planctomycetota bacterium]
MTQASRSRVLGAGARLRPSARLVAALLLLSTAVPAFARQEEEQAKFLTIDNVAAQPESSGAVIKVSGANLKLPSGAKVEFQVLWRSQEIGRYFVTIEGAKFTAEFKVPKEKIPATEDRCYFLTLVRLDEQKAAVKSELEKDKVSFPPGLNPWSLYHKEKSFSLAAAEFIAAENKFMREYFQSRAERLGELFTKFETALENARNKKEYTKNDALDEKKWRGWIDKEMLEPLRALQKEIAESKAIGRFRPHRSSLELLRELTCAVAQLITQQSVALYKEKSLEPNPIDLKPQDHNLEVKTRQRADKEYLAKVCGDLYAKLPAEVQETPKQPEKPAAPEKEKKGSGS